MACLLCSMKGGIHDPRHPSCANFHWWVSHTQIRKSRNLSTHLLFTLGGWYTFYMEPILIFSTAILTGYFLGKNHSLLEKLSRDPAQKIKKVTKLFSKKGETVIFTDIDLEVEKEEPNDND